MSNCRVFALTILEDVKWNIETAIQLFFEGGSSHGISTELPSNPSSYLDSTVAPTVWGSANEDEDEDEDKDEDEVDDGQKHFDLNATIQPRFPEDGNQGEEAQEHLDFDSEIVPTLESSSGTSEDSDWKEEEYNETNLFMFMFHGNLHEAKVESSYLDKWLLVTVQTRDQYTLNRETWSNDIVQDLLRSHFLFWEINDQDSEGQKVSCFYKLMTLPAILVVDPITGQKMYDSQGMKQQEDLLEDLMRFSDRSPKQHLLASTHIENASASTDQTVANEPSQPKETSPEPTTKTSYSPLPEEPTEKHICKVGICLPSGERVQRSFLKTDSTKLLWSFCSNLLKKEEECQSFCFIVLRSPMLFYDTDTSFEEAGLSNTPF